MDSSNKIPSISSLHDEKNIKEKSRINMFKIVLNKCVDKIIYTNRHTDKTFVIFEVPRILIGYPFYDLKSCIVFLLQELSKNNYYVEYIEPFYLYIDWGSKSNSKSNHNNQGNNSHDKKTLNFNEELIKKTLNAPKIEIVYEDILEKLERDKKKKKKKRKK
jgi:hypothetical protein